MLTTRTIPTSIHPIIINTLDNILGSTPTSGIAAIATDTGEFYIANGTNWLHIVPNAAVISASAPDMGAEQDSAPTGYGDTYITDKTLNSIIIGANGSGSPGGLRVTSSGFQVYLNGAWNTIVNNFVLRENSNFSYTLEHAPIGFTNYLEIMTGQSLNNLGLNGYPLTNAYTTSMGAYPFPAIVGGRTIS